MTSTASRPDTVTADDQHLDRRQRLEELRVFRMEQLAELERKPEAAPQHGCVRKSLHMAATTALAEIETALDRMARGSYGSCVSCARPISADRLDVLPMAALCTPCHFNEQNCRIDR